MSAKAQVTALTKVRQSNAIQAAQNFGVVRSGTKYGIKQLFWGDNGEVQSQFNNVRGGLELDPEGNFIDAYGLNLPPDRIYLEERFLKAPKLTADLTWGSSYVQAQAVAAEIANPNFLLQGTNAVDTCAVVDPDGGILLTTTTASNDQNILAPQGIAGQSPFNTILWKTQQSVRFDCVLWTRPTITGMIIWAGLKLTNTPTVATDANQIFFRYQDTVSNGFWECHAARSGTDTNLVSGSSADGIPAVAASTAYRLTIIVNSSLVPRFFINGLEVGGVTNGSGAPATPLAPLTTAISLIPFIGVQTTGAAAKSLKVAHLALSRNIA